MKHSRFFLVLFFVLIAGIFLVSASLNQQLSCRAAPVVDVQVSDDSLQLAVLNVPWSVPKPAIPASLKKFSLPQPSLPDFLPDFSWREGEHSPSDISLPESEYSLPELAFPELSLPEFFSSRAKLLASEVVDTGEYLFHEVFDFLIAFGQDTAAALEVKGQALQDYMEKRWGKSQTEER